MLEILFPFNGKQRLHLGCGNTLLEGWINLDLVAGPGVDLVYNLDNCANEPLPLEENSVDEFLASHLIEHLHNPLPFMEELYRVAKPGARAIFRLPHGASDDAFEDPTHARQYFLNSFEYFSQPTYWRADYGYRGDWQTEKVILIVGQEHQGKSHEQILHEVQTCRNVVKEMIVFTHAVKPAREQRKELRQPLQIEFKFS